MHQNPFSAGDLPLTPLGKLTTLGGRHLILISLPLAAFGASLLTPVVLFG